MGFDQHQAHEWIDVCTDRPTRSGEAKLSNKLSKQHLACSVLMSVGFGLRGAVLRELSRDARVIRKPCHRRHDVLSGPVSP